MKTCTCPHEATRNGFMRTGYNSLCPFHGKPLPEVPRRVGMVPELAAGFAPVAAIQPRETGEKCCSARNAA